MRLSVLAVCLIYVIGTVSGCGNSSQRESGSISGRVFLGDGTNPESGAVNLYAPTSGDAAQANFDSSGAFKFKEVPVGDYQISVTPPPELPPGDPNFVALPPTRIPTKYFSASTSGLTITVKTGENPLELHLK